MKFHLRRLSNFRSLKKAGEMPAFIFGGNMKYLVMLSTLLATSVYSTEETCLDKRISDKEIKSITGTGLTIEEARIELYKKLPEIGVLQTVKLKSTKISSSENYHESSVLTKSINASFDHISIKNCRLRDGRYASSAALPIEGISYLPNEPFPKSSFKKEYATFSFAKSVCGESMYTVIVSMNDHFSVSGGRTAFQKREYGISLAVVCGAFKLKSEWFNHDWSSDVREIFAERYSLIYLGSYRNKDIRDYSQELGLEMIKNVLASE